MTVRPYSFLNNTGLDYLPNPYNLPVFWVRVRGGRWERQPAVSMEEAVRKFVKYADVKSGVVEALAGDQDPERDTPCEYPIKGKPRVVVK